MNTIDKLVLIKHYAYEMYSQATLLLELDDLALSLDVAYKHNIQKLHKKINDLLNIQKEAIENEESI